jgi:TPR repeat protein
MGHLYAGAYGVEENKATALTFYRKSCDGGYMVGCNELADVEEAEAGKLYAKACEKNLWKACESLGLLYSNGADGIPLDKVKAVSLFDKACKGGFMGACENLADAYMMGEGVEEDPAEAKRLNKLACEGGAQEACYFAK